MLDLHDAIGVGIRQRAKQHAVHDTEDRDVRADPERERRQNDRREGRLRRPCHEGRTGCLPMSVAIMSSFLASSVRAVNGMSSVHRARRERRRAVVSARSSAATRTTSATALAQTRATPNVPMLSRSEPAVMEKVRHVAAEPLAEIARVEPQQEAIGAIRHRRVAHVAHRAGSGSMIRLASAARTSARSRSASAATTRLPSGESA